MLRNPYEQPNGQFEICASMTSLPHTNLRVKKCLEELLSLARSMAEKFGVEKDYVKIRMNTSSDKVKILFLNGLSGAKQPDIDPANQKPINFLKVYGGQLLEKETARYPYQSYSVVEVANLSLKSIQDALASVPKNDVDPGIRNIAGFNSRSHPM